ncbi:MAG TPA: CoA transferase [Chloroflexota bacterium]|jgi:crotonobetainyl-CoA:carnitine CoA-transferase CaiB-like acyl-CoA transferase|nr:CoA transferase [Chloroflexota bacterium]
MTDFIPTQTGALSGVRVLDMATFIAGPFCAGLLAEFGADVIKIEQPGAGDSLRELGEKVNDRALFWALEDRGRRSVTCNLRVERGQALALELIKQSDIIVENFRPGTLERWNLGYERMREVNPGVILVRVSAYGQTGPYSDRPGFGRIAQAFGGLTYLAGFPDRPPVLPGSATLADYAAGLFSALAALAAKHHRDRTGEGQQVDVSLYESIFRFCDVLALAYDSLGIVRERKGSAAHAAPHNHYPTSDGKWIAIACTNDRIFRRLAACMGQPSWGTDPAFDTMEKRSANRVEVDARVSAWTSTMPMSELREMLDAAEVPTSPIYSIQDAFEDPQYQARATLQQVDDPVIGPVMMPSPVPRLSLTPTAVQRPAPAVGEHNEEIYGGLLGVSAEDLEGLRAEGVI